MKKIIFTLGIIAPVAAYAQNTGIGITNPNEKLEVAGNIKSTTINANFGAATDKVVVADASGVMKTVDRKGVDTNAWQLTGNSITSGQFIGTTNDEDLIFKRNNINAGIITYNKRSTAFGANALSKNRGINNTAIGYSAMQNAADQMIDSNTAIGSFALWNNNGTSNVGVGVEALGSGNAVSSVAIGALAATNTVGAGNVMIGAEAGQNGSGFFNTFIGNRAGLTFSGDFNISIGARTSTATGNTLNIGDVIYGADIQNSSVLDPKIGIGVQYPSEKLEIAGRLKLQPQDGKGTCDDSSKGVMVFDSTDNHFYGCRGTAGGWATLSMGTTTGTGGAIGN